MSAALDFLKIFSGQLREAGVRFAMVSGVAPAWPSDPDRGRYKGFSFARNPE